MISRFVVAMAATLLVSKAAVAQNVVANSTFDASLSGWMTITGGGTPTVSLNTMSGSPTVPLGAAQLSVTGGNDSTLDIGQCIAIGAGPYSFGGRSYLVTGTGAASNLVLLQLYPMAGCSGSVTNLIAGTSGTVSGIANGVTVNYTQHNTTNVMPGANVSARLLAQGQVSGAGSFTSLFDSMFLQCTSDSSAPAVTAPSAVTRTQTVCM